MKLLTLEQLDRIRTWANEAAEHRRKVYAELGENGQDGQMAAYDYRTAITQADAAVRRWIAEELYREPLTVERMRDVFPTLDVSRLPEGYLEERLAQANRDDEGRISLVNAFLSATFMHSRATLLLTDFAPYSFTFDNGVVFGGIIFHGSTWSVHT